MSSNTWRSIIQGRVHCMVLLYGVTQTHSLVWKSHLHSRSKQGSNQSIVHCDKRKKKRIRFSLTDASSSSRFMSSLHKKCLMKITLSTFWRRTNKPITYSQMIDCIRSFVNVFPLIVSQSLFSADDLFAFTLLRRQMVHTPASMQCHCDPSSVFRGDEEVWYDIQYIQYMAANSC